MQTTLKTSARFVGVGLHSGASARLSIHPASAEYGIWFRRTDVDGDGLIAARWDAADPDAKLCTRISNDAGVTLSTIEHVMAALVGCGVHNALVEVDGPEVPVLDGSAQPFVEGILAAGLRELDAPIRVIEVLKPVEVRDGEASARLDPADALYMDFHIDFTDEAIGRQEKTMSLANGSFVRELCDSRTFCRKEDITAMRSQGLALGGTLENAVVVDGDRVVSPGGLRHADEAVRHKMLDAVGDLALAGAPLLARYSGHRSGHSLTNRLLRALFSDPTAYRMIVCDKKCAARLPGVGVRRADVPLLA